MSHFLDTSALVKLIVAEPESEQLRAYLRDRGGRRVASGLARTELRRAVRRLAPELLVSTDTLLAGLTLVRLDDSLLDAAGALGPDVLRSLDAVHLASALRAPSLAAVVTYDVRMQQAAAELGLPVVAPAT